MQKVCRPTTCAISDIVKKWKKLAIYVLIFLSKVHEDKG